MSVSTFVLIIFVLFVSRSPATARFTDCTTLSTECCWRPANFSAPWQRHESIDQSWYRKNFRIGMLRPPPDNLYYSTVVSDPNEISALESCSYCSRTGDVKVWLRHWASASTTMELCWSQVTGQRNVTECRELDPNKHGMIESQQISIQRNIPVFFSLILKAQSASVPATGLVDFVNVKSELCSLNIQRLKPQRLVSLGGSHLAIGRDSNSRELNGRTAEGDFRAAGKFLSSEEDEKTKPNALDSGPSADRQLDRTSERTDPVDHVNFEFVPPTAASWPQDQSRDSLSNSMSPGARPPSIAPTDVFDLPSATDESTSITTTTSFEGLASRLQIAIDEFNQRTGESSNSLTSPLAGTELRTTELSAPPPTAEMIPVEAEVGPPLKSSLFIAQQRSEFVGHDKPTAPLSFAKMFDLLTPTSAPGPPGLLQPPVPSWPPPSVIPPSSAPLRFAPFVAAPPSSPMSFVQPTSGVWSSAVPTAIAESNDPPDHASFSLPRTVDLAPVEFAAFLPAGPSPVEIQPPPWLVAPQQFGTQINRRPPPVIPIAAPKSFNPFADLFGEEFAEFLDPAFNTTKYDELEIRYEKNRAPPSFGQTGTSKFKPQMQLPTSMANGVSRGMHQSELQIARLPQGATPQAAATASFTTTTTTTVMPMETKNGGDSRRMHLESNDFDNRAGSLTTSKEHDLDHQRQTAAPNPLKLRPPSFVRNRGENFEGFGTMQDRYRAFTPTTTTTTTSATPTTTSIVTSTSPVPQTSTSLVRFNPLVLSSPRPRAIEPISLVRSHAPAPIVSDNVDYPRLGRYPGRRNEEQEGRGEQNEFNSWKPTKKAKSCFYSGGCLFEKSSCGFANSRSLATKGEFRRVSVGKSNFVEARISPGEVAVFESSVNTTRGFYVLFDYLEWTEGEKLSACCLTPGRDPIESYCPYESSTNETDVVWENGQIYCEPETTKIMFICENFGGRGGICAFDNVRLHAEWDPDFLQPCQGKQLIHL